MHVGVLAERVCVSAPASHISTGYVSQQLVSLDQFFECVCVCVCVCVVSRGFFKKLRQTQGHLSFVALSFSSRQHRTFACFEGQVIAYFTALFSVITTNSLVI